MKLSGNRRGGFISVQSLSHIQLFATPWIGAHQASLSITNFWILLKIMSIALVMSSNHLILCCPLFLLPLIFPSIRVFSNESAHHIRWPKYWSFTFQHQSFQFRVDFLKGWLTGLISLQSKGLSRVFSNTPIRKHQFLGPQTSLWPNSHIHA